MVVRCSLLMICQETIDFDVLKYQARTDEEAAKSQQIPDELLRVIVLVKNSLLALRYQLPDGKVCVCGRR